MCDSDDHRDRIQRTGEATWDRLRDGLHRRPVLRRRGPTTAGMTPGRGHFEKLRDNT
jgi:hypothetical protein